MDKEKNISIRITRGGIAEVGRSVKNVSEKKFDLSKPGSALFAAPHEVVFDGQSGDLIARANVEPHVAKEIRRNPDFFPTEADYSEIPSLAERLDDQEREQYGKTLAEMDIAELLSVPEIAKELLKVAQPIS